MLGIWLELTVVEKDGDAYLHRYIELPFPPFLGLMLNFGPEDSGNYFVIESLSYDVDADVFHAREYRESSECPCKQGEGCCSVKNWAEYDGWTVASVRSVAEIPELQRKPWQFSCEDR